MDRTKDDPVVVTTEQLRKIRTPQLNELYSYWRLQEKDWFRLLVVGPSVNPYTVLECSLIHQPMDKAPPYEAISYTWGDGEADSSIFIDGCVFRIRTNLHHALRVLRNENTFRLLWVDALCIDQSHNTERGQQVSQMGRVYSNAKDVLIWLGERTQYSDLGMDSIRELAEGFYQTGLQDDREESVTDVEERTTAMADYLTSFLAKPGSEARLLAIASVFSTHWWVRVWTVQEIVLARSATVCYGKRKLRWIVFNIFMKCLHMPRIFEKLVNFVPRSKGGSQAIEMLYALGVYPNNVIDIRSLHQGPDSIGLSSIVNKTKTYIATDPRDKIYGILGLVSQNHGLKPDYDCSVNKLYVMAFKVILKEDRDLRSFSWLIDCPGSIANGLPSWVPYFPDFTNLIGKNNLVPISGARQESCGPVYYTSSLSNEIGRPFMEFEEEDTVLKLKGVVVDVIVNSSDVAPPLRYIKESATRSLAKTISSWNSLSSQLEGEHYVTGISKYEAFWRTIVLDQKVVGYHAKYFEDVKGNERRLESTDAFPPSNVQDEKRLISALDKQRSLGGFQFSRRLFATQRGYLGLAPPHVRKRDLVCVLLGGEVPYVLRRRDDGSYTMIGECYVHGIMDGEVMNGVEEGEYSLQSFSLR